MREYILYPLDSLLNLSEQFCHPLSNKLDHCELLVRFENLFSYYRGGKGNGHPNQIQGTLYDVYNSEKRHGQDSKFRSPTSNLSSNIVPKLIQTICQYAFMTFALHRFSCIFSDVKNWHILQKSPFKREEMEKRHIGPLKINLDDEINNC